MAVERFDMFHKDHGGKARTTQAAYDALWFDNGWRKSPPKNAPASAGASNDPAPSGSPDPSGDTDDTKEASQ